MVVGNTFCKLFVGALFDSVIEFQCVRGEHMRVRRGGGWWGGGLPAGVIRASHGTFSYVFFLFVFLLFFFLNTYFFLLRTMHKTVNFI